MRPIIMHIDYTKKTPHYANAKDTSISKNIINIQNENTHKLKYNAYTQAIKEKVNLSHSENTNNKINNLKKTIAKPSHPKENKIKHIDNIDEFVEMIKSKNIIYNHSIDKKTSNYYVNLIKNHRKLFIPTGKNDHTIILSPADRIGKGVYGTAYRIGNYVIKLPNNADLLKYNKNADYTRCAKILNDVNKDNNFSRSIKLNNNQNILITKYVEGQSVTGKEAYNFVQKRGRILFDYDSEGNVRKNKEGQHILIDADFAAQPKGLYRTTSIGTLDIQETYKQHHKKYPITYYQIPPLYYKQLDGL